MGVTRRAVLAGAGALLATPSLRTSAQEAPTRRIPASGEPVPAVGIGSWITFNVGDDPLLRAECRAVMAAFFEEGGGIVDSSPMYGSSQAVIGDALATLGHPPGLFSADKVWTDAAEGPAQIAQTTRRWGVGRFDLLQVHNLIDWGGQSRHPRRHEGGGAAALYRRHHLARPPARGAGGGHAPPAAGLRAAHL